MTELSYDDLEKKVLGALDKTSFAQTEADFEMPKVIPNSELIGLGIGAGISGLVSGAVTKFVPFDFTQFGVAGLPQIIVGTAIKLLAKPKGMVKDVTNGMIVAGISEAVSGVTGSLNLAQERDVSISENTQIQTGVVF